MRIPRAVPVAALAAFVVAIIGGSMTTIGPWYDGLQKSPLNPPNWLFGPAWMMIYALTVIAAVDGWRALSGTGDRAWFLSLYFFNVVLNILWSFLFFTARRPDWALAEVFAFWASILALVVFTSRLSRRGALLLGVYLAWVTFAAYLNVEVVRLNGPFG